MQSASMLMKRSTKKFYTMPKMSLFVFSAFLDPNSCTWWCVKFSLGTSMTGERLVHHFSCWWNIMMHVTHRSWIHGQNSASTESDTFIAAGEPFRMVIDGHDTPFVVWLIIDPMASTQRNLDHWLWPLTMASHATNPQCDLMIHQIDQSSPNGHMFAVPCMWSLE